jgi:small conductance mechanosensitive channel
MEKLLVRTNLIDQYSSTFTTAFIDYCPKLIGAFLLLILGIWAIRFINSVSRKIMIKREVEPTLIKFLSDIIFWGLRIVLFIAVISKLGIESSSFLAILGAAGLAVGLSLQGSLSNFAGGILIILFKPFKLGDTIEAQGTIGKVIDIQIFVTQLLTGSNEVVFIPNGILSNGKIVNFSEKSLQRTDLTIRVSYQSDLKEVKSIILEVVNSIPKVLQNEKPLVFVKELGESSIFMSVQAWTTNEDYKEVCSTILENCKKAFDENQLKFQHA